MSKIILSKISTDAPAKADKEKMVKETEKMAKEIGEFADKFYAEKTQFTCSTTRNGRKW